MTAHIPFTLVIKGLCFGYLGGPGTRSESNRKYSVSLARHPGERRRSTEEARAPKDHINARILHSGSKARYEGGYQICCCIGSLCLCGLLGPAENANGDFYFFGLGVSFTLKQNNSPSMILGRFLE